MVQQHPVHLSVSLEALDGEVIDPDQLDTRLQQKSGTVQGKRGKILVELRLVPKLRVVRLQQQSVGALDPQPLQFLAPDLFYAGDLDHQCLPDQDIERYLVYADAGVDEMVRCIDMGAAVGAECDAG